MSEYVCQGAAGPLRAEVTIPGSKSLTQRALVTAALADGTSILTNLLLAEDTELMIEALRSLGVAVTLDESNGTVEVTGCRGFLPCEEARLFCGNAGTVMRFLCALTALGQGRYELDGNLRMRRRPIGALVDALCRLGGAVEYLGPEGFPPVVVHARGLRGSHLRFGAAESSQFVSAVLLAAPYAAGDMFMEISDDVPSRPYVTMTVSVMRAFGVEMIEDRAGGMSRFIVPAPQRYRAQTFAVEADASNASYFLAAPAVAGGSVTVRGLDGGSVQGDVRFLSILERMGCQVEHGAGLVTVHGPEQGRSLLGIDVDLNSMPDVVPTLAALALFARGPTSIRNVAHLRVKESDRLSALSTELTKLGAGVEERADGLTIFPPSRIVPATLETHNDHRLAMSFALIGLGCPGLVVRNPECCRKSFPGFFELWELKFASRGPR